MTEEVKGTVDGEPTTAEPTGEAATEESREAPVTKDELNVIVADRDRFEKNYKTSQRTINEKNRELDRLKNQPQSSGSTEVLEAMLKAIPRQKDEYGNPQKPSPEVLKAEQFLRTAKYRDMASRRATQMEGERQKIIKEAEELGLDVLGEEFYAVEDAFDLGNVEAARRRFDRIAKKHQKAEPKGDNVKETEEDMKQRIRAEVVKELSKQDTSNPSGASQVYTRESIAKMSVEDFAAKRDDIDKAYQAGNIK